jgi:hypothetical protein
MIRREDGQTTVEYLMISGMLTVIAAAVLSYTYMPFVRLVLQALVDRVINDPVF